jgi:predicted nucleic acid-binding protein
MTLVIDASVAVKWYLDEPLSGKAREILAGDDLLVAPELILAEVGNAAWLRVNKGDISLGQATEIVRELPGAFVALVPTERLIVRAVEIAAELKHPVYDALYLAVADRWDAMLISDDGRLIAKAADTVWAGRVKPLGDVSPTA